MHKKELFPYSHKLLLAGTLALTMAAGAFQEKQKPTEAAFNPKYPSLDLTLVPLDHH